MPVRKSSERPTAPAIDRMQRTELAREERARVDSAIRELERALATASWHREQSWQQRVQETFNMVAKALDETRRSANAPDSLFSEVIAKAPRLEPRVKRIQYEYEELVRQIGSLRGQISANAAIDGTDIDVDDVRQRLRWLLTALQHAQAKEAELLYEAFQVDIGQGD